MAENPKLYKIICPYCGKKQRCHPSIFQLMGLHDFGGGDCLKCEKHMQIIYHPDTDSMSTRKWEDFEQEIKQEAQDGK